VKPAITVAIGATCEVTRLVVMREAQGAREVLRARLGPPSQVHRLAAPLLLESLALWYQQPVRVVLCAESDAISSALQLLRRVRLRLPHALLRRRILSLARG